MRLIISLISSFNYSAGVSEFPVEIKVITDVPVEMCYLPRVKSALLTKVGDQDPCFGYVMNVTPAREKLVVLLPESPVDLRVNVFEHDDDFDDLVSGEYFCDISVLAWGKVDGQFRAVELQGRIPVVLK